MPLINSDHEDLYIVCIKERLIIKLTMLSFTSPGKCFPSRECSEPISPSQLKWKWNCRSVYVFLNFNFIGVVAVSTVKPSALPLFFNFPLTIRLACIVGSGFPCERLNNDAGPVFASAAEVTISTGD